jgi:hypothetical protein
MAGQLYMWAARRGRTGRLLSAPGSAQAEYRCPLNWVSVSAELAGMSNNAKYGQGRAKEEVPGCLPI